MLWHACVLWTSLCVAGALHVSLRKKLLWVRRSRRHCQSQYHCSLTSTWSSKLPQQGSDSETKLPMRDVLLPQQSPQQRGRKEYNVPLPQQLASGTPRRHCAEAAAATAGIGDAGTSRPTRIALQSAPGTLNLPSRTLSTIHQDVRDLSATSAMLSWPLPTQSAARTPQRLRIHSTASWKDAATSSIGLKDNARRADSYTVHNCHEVLNPKWSRNNLKARTGQSNMHLLWNRDCNTVGTSELARDHPACISCGIELDCNIVGTSNLARVCFVTITCGIEQKNSCIR